jgi:SCY1-like protein 1
VREQTVKAVLTIISKLSDRTINGELLKYLAKTSNDEQPGIRTNTTICLGKISKHLGANTRAKVLVAAFTRSLRDPFVHARNAALMALAATSDAFSEDDCATKILPALCPSLVDKEKLVRDQANKTVDAYLQRVRKHAASMPDTVLPPSSTTETSAAAAPRMGTPQASDAASWAGWAISSFTNKISSASGEMQPNTNSNHSARPSSVPPTGDPRRPMGTSSASALHRQAVTSPPPASTRTSTSSNANDFFQDATGDDEIEIDDAWGDMDEDNFVDASDAQKTSKASTSKTTPFDDGGEPDFAGWLAAQSQKKPNSKPLPKGLSKPTVKDNGRPSVAGRAASAGTLGGSTTKKMATLTTRAVSKPVVTKKVDTKPKDSNDDDGWGDGW